MRQQAELTMKCLRKWLMDKFNLDLEMEGDILSHGIQTDTFNCGPAMANTIEHNVFGRELWTPATSVQDRIHWFLRLSMKWGKVEESRISSAVSAPPNSDEKVRRHYFQNPLQTDIAQIQIQALLQEDIAASVALAEGDHNFPDLAEFIVSTLINDDEKDPVVERLSSARTRMSIAHLMNPQNDHQQSELNLVEQATVAGLNETQAETSDAESNYDSASNYSTELSNGDSGSSSDGMDVDKSSQSSEKHTSKESSSQQFKSNASLALDKGAKHSKKVLLKKRFRSSDDLGDIQQNTKRPCDGGGISKSAKASKAKRDSFKAGTLYISAKQLAEWKKEVLKNDPHAEFDPSNIRRVRHSRCGNFFQVKEPLDLTRWRTHCKECTSKDKVGKASNTRSLFSMGWVKRSKTRIPTAVAGNGPKTLADPQQKPCPGLSELDDKRIPMYLRRTAAIGGGGRSIHTIASEMFHKIFSKLSKVEKEEVVQEQRHGHQWWNDHQQLKVFSTKCEKTVPNRSPNRPLPCPYCEKVRKSRVFRKILKKPMPLPRNRVFVNKSFRNPVLGEIYGRVLGVEEIVEAHVRSFFFRYVSNLTNRFIKNKEISLRSLYQRSFVGKI
jgi:hypothetical protein